MDKNKEIKKSTKQKAPLPPNDVSLVQTKTSIKSKAPQPPNINEMVQEKENYSPVKEKGASQLMVSEKSEVSAETHGVKAKKINWDKNIIKSLVSTFLFSFEYKNYKINNKMKLCVTHVPLCVSEKPHS